MHISKIKISGILGIDNLEFSAGRFNVASGPNGTGKTSVLEAIKSVVKGGEDATLLRKGSKRGEIVLLLDDNTEIKKRLTEKTTTTTVERNGVQVQRPTEVIKALTDMLSVNPVDFIRAPKKQRVNVLLESLPMSADPERLAEIVGYTVAVDENKHALEQMSSVRQAVFDDRTGTNRAIREKESTINQLAVTLPDIDAESPDVDKSGLLATLNEIDAKKDAELERISTKLNGFRAERDSKISAIRTGADGLIAGWQAEIDALRNKIDAEKASTARDIAIENEDFSKIESKAAQQREITLAEHSAAREGTSSKLAAIEAQQTLAAKHSQTRQTIRIMRDEADKLKEDAERQTSALDALDAYKSELLAALPIDGLTVTDGEIFRHDVAFDRLNTAQQVEIAVEIAKLRAGKLGVICVDGIELLDSSHFEAFREQILATDLQLFVAKVSDEEFGIISE